MRNELVAVTDAEHRYTRMQNRRIDICAAGLVYAARAAGNDEPAPGFQDVERSFARLYVGKHPEFADFTGDEMRILPAGIENRDLRRGSRRRLKRHESVRSKGKKL